MSRATIIAGFVSAITPSDNLNVGILTARNLTVTGVSTFAGSIDIHGGVAYADVAGIATVATNAQGLTGTPNITVDNINASGVVTATCICW